MHNVLPSGDTGLDPVGAPTLPLNGAWESDGCRVKSRIVGAERGAQSAEQTWEQTRETLEHARHTVDGGQLLVSLPFSFTIKIPTKVVIRSIGSPVRRKD